MEAKNYPFIALQWHPEKNTYEWSKHIDIPHGYCATEVTHQVLVTAVIKEQRHHQHAYMWVVVQRVVAMLVVLVLLAMIVENNVQQPNKPACHQQLPACLLCSHSCPQQTAAGPRAAIMLQLTLAIPSCLRCCARWLASL